MKKLLLILISSFVFLSTHAQLTYWKDTVQFSNAPKNNTIIRLYDTVYNNSANAITFNWKINEINLLNGWSIDYIGTNIACFPFDTSINHTYIIAPNSKMNFMIFLKAIQSADDGCNSVSLKVDNSKLLYFNFCSSPTSIKEIELNDFVSIYPNPAKSNISLQIKNQNCGQISLSTVDGKMIKTFDISNQNSYSFNTQNLSSGIYFITFFDKLRNKLGTEKIVVE